MDSAAMQAYDRIQEAFDRRYRVKKATNLTVSAVIALLGVTSFLYGLRLEPMPTIFRWMTVDGTLFTTFGAIVYIAVNLVELLRKTELTRVSAYYIRLSSAVAESVILSVVLVSQLPFFPEHPVCCALTGILISIVAGTPVGSTIVAADIAAFLVCSAVSVLKTHERRIVWGGEHVYPDDYPEEGNDIVVTGRLEAYEEDGFLYLHLVDAEVLWEDEADAEADA